MKAIITHAGTEKLLTSVMHTCYWEQAFGSQLSWKHLLTCKETQNLIDTAYFKLFAP